MPIDNVKQLQFGTVSISDNETGEEILTLNGSEFCTTFTRSDECDSSNIKFDLNKEATFSGTMSFTESGYKTYKALGIYDSFNITTKIELIVKHWFWMLSKKNK
jgi:hypothetical protein